LMKNRENSLPDALGQGFVMLIQALSGIRGLMSIVSGDLDETDMIDRALQVMKQNLDFERGSLFLFNDREELYCAGGIAWQDTRENAGEQQRNRHVFRPGQGIMGQAADSRRLYHCRDCRQDKNYLPIIDAKIDRNAGSIICAPVLAGEDLLGMLNVSHPEPFFFHPWQEHVISIHADILARMLHNHRLMKDMATQVKNRTRELQDSLDETKSLKLKYKALSFIDDLTQIYNRRYFFSEVPSALSRALRYRQNLSLLFIDIDHFKSVNDNYGHEFGDRVLRDVASVLSRQSRKGDILARMGGEEFALAIPSTDMEGIRLLAQRIRTAVSGLRWQCEGACFGVTVSIGISNVQQPGVNEDSCLDRINEIVHVLVREADKALYHCKDTGRDRVTFYQDLDRVS